MSSDTDFRPSGPPRPNQIYTSWRLHKALGYVTKKLGGTREDIAEEVLHNYVAEKHPEILLFLKQRDDDENTFIKKLNEGRATVHNTAL